MKLNLSDREDDFAPGLPRFKAELKAFRATGGAFEVGFGLEYGGLEYALHESLVEMLSPKPP